MSTAGLIAFDLDGTLIDSVAGIHASLVAACSALELSPPSLELLRTRIGPPLREYLPGMLGLAPVESDRLLEPLLQSFRMHHEQQGWRHYQLYDGAMQLLRSLEARGWQLHVVTLKPAPIAERVLRESGIGRHVRSLHAPQPGARIDKAVHLGELRDPGHAVHWYVGDTRGDQRAAAAAGYGFMAAAYGYGADLEAQHHLCEPLDLLRCLEGRP